MTTSSTTGSYTGGTGGGTTVAPKAFPGVYELPRGLQKAFGQHAPSSGTAGVAELVDALDLGSSDASRVFHRLPG